MIQHLRMLENRIVKKESIRKTPPGVTVWLLSAVFSKNIYKAIDIFMCILYNVQVIVEIFRICEVVQIQVW